MKLSTCYQWTITVTSNKKKRGLPFTTLVWYLLWVFFRFVMFLFCFVFCCFVCFVMIFFCHSLYWQKFETVDLNVMNSFNLIFIAFRVFPNYLALYFCLDPIVFQTNQSSQQNGFWFEIKLRLEILIIKHVYLINCLT